MIEELRLTQPSVGLSKGRTAGAFGTSENIGILREIKGAEVIKLTLVGIFRRTPPDTKNLPAAGTEENWLLLL